MVLTHCGVDVERASLRLISTAYRKRMDIQQLFVEVDKTAQVRERLPAFERHWHSVRSILESDTKPANPELIAGCRSCEFFRQECIGQGIEHSIFELPNLHPNRLMRLKGDNTLTSPAYPGNTSYPKSTGELSTACSIIARSCTMSCRPSWRKSNGLCSTSTLRLSRPSCLCTTLYRHLSRC